MKSIRKVTRKYIVGGNEKMDEQKKDYRVEQDSIGTKDVPKSVYYGCLLYTSFGDSAWTGYDAMWKTLKKRNL